MVSLHRIVRRGGTLESVFAAAVMVLGLAGCGREEQTFQPPVDSPSDSSSSTPPVSSPDPAFLYGRVTADNGEVYEGRLRWGRSQEAFWEDYFNGSKDNNPWVAHLPAGSLPARRPVRIFGFQIGGGEEADLRRPFMARFGDIARIEARRNDVRVTMKSGTVFDLDRMGANDLDDGVRVWDAKRGIVDLESWSGAVPPPPYRRIRAIELVGSPGGRAAPVRLHGTVTTRHGKFTGFVAWDREKCVGSDELAGRTADGEITLRFDTIQSIVRRSPGGPVVRLADGRDIVLSSGRGGGEANRGIYVDDHRYGRVLIAWEAFERVDFSPGPGSPSYSDFPPGRPLTGSVTTSDGRRLAGRLIYDLDESETTETLDAPHEGVNYMLPFALVASIAAAGLDERGAAHARVTLHSGERLTLEGTGDLGRANAGILIFAEGSTRADYVSWADVAQIDFDRPPAMYPPPPALTDARSATGRSNARVAPSTAHPSRQSVTQRDQSPPDRRR